MMYYTFQRESRLHFNANQDYNRLQENKNKIKTRSCRKSRDHVKTEKYYTSTMLL